MIVTRRGREECRTLSIVHVAKDMILMRTIMVTTKGVVNVMIVVILKKKRTKSEQQCYVGDMIPTLIVMVTNDDAGAMDVVVSTTHPPAVVDDMIRTLKVMASTDEDGAMIVIQKERSGSIRKPHVGGTILAQMTMMVAQKMQMRRRKCHQGTRQV